MPTLCQPWDVTLPTETATSRRDERRRNLWPLPGGVDQYAVSLLAMLEAASDDPSRLTYLERVSGLFPQVTSASTVKGYAAVLVTLGFVEPNGAGLVSLTEAGRRFGRSADMRILREALVCRVFGAHEVLAAVAAGPTTYPILQRQLAQSGVEWANAMALRYRIWWLRASGAVEAERKMRSDWLTITTGGRRTLTRSPLADAGPGVARSTNGPD